MNEEKNKDQKNKQQGGQQGGDNNPQAQKQGWDQKESETAETE